MMLGKVPSKKDKLIMYVIGPTNISMLFFKIEVGMPVGPQAFYFRKDETILDTSSSSTGLRSSISVFFLLGIHYKMKIHKYT